MNTTKQLAKYQAAINNYWRLEAPLDFKPQSFIKDRNQLDHPVSVTKQSHFTPAGKGNFQFFHGKSKLVSQK